MSGHPTRPIATIIGMDLSTLVFLIGLLLALAAVSIIVAAAIKYLRAK